MATEAVAAQAPAEATDAGTESASELRDTLIAKLKENAEAREAGTTAEPKPKPATEKPKRGDKPEAAATGKDDEDAAGDTPEVKALKAERRGFAKHKRKWEASAQAREEQLRTFESTVKQQVAAFERDPIAWLKAQKVDIRATLLRMTKEESEDPRDKELREVKEEQKRIKERDAERDAAAAKAGQERAVQMVQRELAGAWEKAEVDEYPTLAAMLEPEHIAERACEIMLEEYRRSGKELAPSKIFATMEEELAPLKGRLKPREKVNGQKKPEAPGAGPGSKRKDREAASPEARERQRPSEDVTRRITRETSVGRPLNFDREAIRERLVSKARDVMR